MKRHLNFIMYENLYFFEWFNCVNNQIKFWFCPEMVEMNGTWSHYDFQSKTGLMNCRSLKANQHNVQYIIAEGPSDIGIYYN